MTMIEDKLNPDERVRLEALAQSIAYSATVERAFDGPPSPEKIVERALQFAKFIAGDEAAVQLPDSVRCMCGEYLIPPGEDGININGGTHRRHHSCVPAL